MPSFIDISGKTYGQWTVESRGPNGPRGQTRWWCVCACGTRKLIFGLTLRPGGSGSCGCERTKKLATMHRTHGLRHLPEYKIWYGLRARGLNPNDKAFKNYGGRGITVVWTCFEDFYAAMGARPSTKHSIERLDNNGPYSKENCVWALRQVQERNKRTTRWITHENRTQCLQAWCDEKRLPIYVVHGRLKRGWSVEKALTTPVLQRAPRRKSSQLLLAIS